MAFLFRRAQRSAPSPPPPPPLPQTAVSDGLIQPVLTAYTSGNNDSNNAVSDSDQVVQKGTLVTVARSIRHCVAGMSPWDVSDLTLGLYKIATRHALEGVSDSIDGSAVSNKEELEEILYWLDWAWASYLADTKAITEFVHIEGEQLKKHVKTSAILNPAYCIAIDNVKKCVVLSIRGTYAATDILTDLQPHNENFEGGYAHSGILSAARWILGNENDNLKILLSENPGYKLVITGHSLGAGAACLLSYILRESAESENEQISSKLGISSSMIECWGFGCPPCVDKQHCECAHFIKNIVLQDDIIARASVAALEDLRTEILQTNWEDVLEDGGIAKRMLGLVNNTNAALGNVEQALGYPQGTFFQQAKSVGYAAMIESFRAALGRGGGPGFNGPPGKFNIMGQHGPRGNFFCPPRPYFHPGQHGAFGPPEDRGMAYHPYQHSGADRPPVQNLMGWISHGASALGLHFKMPANPSTNGECVEEGRLFVPGILYHIKRSALDAGVVAELEHVTAERGMNEENSSLNVSTGTAAERGMNEENSSLNISTGAAAGPMRHSVIKGLDPNTRFMKIVLSKSLLSDHSLVSYKDAIKDAIKLTEEGRTH